MIVAAEGGPLGVVVAPANVHDCKLLEQTIEANVVERPAPTVQAPQHLCLDKGYNNPTGRAVAKSHGHPPHLRRIGEEKLDRKGRCGLLVHDPLDGFFVHGTGQVLLHRAGQKAKHLFAMYFAVAVSAGIG